MAFLLPVFMGANGKKRRSPRNVDEESAQMARGVTARRNRTAAVIRSIRVLTRGKKGAAKIPAQVESRGGGEVIDH